MAIGARERDAATESWYLMDGGWTGRACAGERWCELGEAQKGGPQLHLAKAEHSLEWSLLSA